MDGGNRMAGQRSRRAAFRAALDRMPGGSGRDEWIRDWQGAHAMALDGLPARPVAQVRVTRAGIRQTADVIRRGVEWAQQG